MNIFIKLTAISAALLLGHNAYSANGIEDLSIFKSGGMTKGLWRMELLNSSEPALNQNSAAVGKVGICMDAAKQLSDNSKIDEQSCTPKIVRNDKDSAEFDVSCKDGSRSHVAVNRESDKSFLMDSLMTGKDGKTRTMKARYSYEGACKGDSVIQMDKNSATCKKMEGVDMSKMAGMCAKVPTEMRAQCEQQMKQMSGMCQ